MHANDDVGSPPPWSPCPRATPDPRRDPPGRDRAAPAPTPGRDDAFAAAATPRAVGRRRLARESPVKFGKPRGGHRGGELLVRLSRRRRLHEPRHEQLREPSRVLRPNPRQEVPHARRQTLRVTGTVPVTRSRTGSRRESPDGVHLPGQRAKLRVQRVARLLAIMVRLLGIRGGAEPGGDEPGGDEPGDASDAAGRRGDPPPP